MMAAVLRSSLPSSHSAQLTEWKSPKTRNLLLRVALPPNASKRTSRISASVQGSVICEVNNLVENSRTWINAIRAALRIEDIAVGLSAYEIAWVARLGSEKPQFPLYLEWILANQAQDGAWGIGSVFQKVRATFACMTALNVWNTGEEHVRRGIDYIENSLTSKFMDSLSDHAVIILSGSLEQNLLAPNKAHIHELQERRKVSLSRLSAEMVNADPCSFFYCLEVCHQEVDWQNLTAFHHRNGSFNNSPVLTACCYINTSDQDCLRYLQLLEMPKTGSKSNAQFKCLGEQLHILDCLDRLGIKRHFEQESQEILQLTYRAWMNVDHQMVPIDTLATAFRLLRLNGYPVSADVFKHLSSQEIAEQAPDVVYNIFLASQTFQLEDDTDEVYRASKKLLEKYIQSENLDNEGILTSSLKNEVRLSLKFPWHSIMQRVEHRHYISEFKKGYFIPSAQNAFLALAKSDFKFCQSIYEEDLKQIMRWHEECEFSKLNFARQKAFFCYFTAAVTMFEPEMSLARIVWAKMSVLTTVFDDFYDTHSSLMDLYKLCDAVERWDPSSLDNEPSADMKIIFNALYSTVCWAIGHGFAAQGRDIGYHLRAYWMRLVRAFMKEAEWRLLKSCPSMKEYSENAVYSFALEPIMMSTIFFMGIHIPHYVIEHPECNAIYRTVSLIGRLQNDIQGSKRESQEGTYDMISIQLRNHPHKTEEEIVGELREMIRDEMQNFVRKIMDAGVVPNAAKCVFGNMVRILNSVYKDEDGFTSKEVEEQAKAIFYASI